MPLLKPLFKESVTELQQSQKRSGLPRHLPSAHDAVAVQQQHQDWAKEVMLKTWQEHLDGVNTKVKVDLA